MKMERREREKKKEGRRIDTSGKVLRKEMVNASKRVSTVA